MYEGLKHSQGNQQMPCSELVDRLFPYNKKRKMKKKKRIASLLKGHIYCIKLLLLWGLEEGISIFCPCYSLEAMITILRVELLITYTEA